MESMIARQSGRLDRYVRRSYLRLNEGVSRHRVAYAIEEALRLAQLPGENEGRIYCFHRVNLSGIPAEANRRILMEAVQTVVGGVASQAIHASDPQAAASNAVYFHNREEALEHLLRRALHARSSNLAAAPPWYSVSLLGTAGEVSEKDQIPVIIEQLFDRGPDATAVAPGAQAILFAVLGDNDPSPLLSAIPADTVRDWIHRLDDAANASADLPALSLPPKLKTVLCRAGSSFGWKDPATIWLAAQAVLSITPFSSRVVRRARAVLRTLESEQRGESLDRRLGGNHDRNLESIVFNEREGTARGFGAAPDAQPVAPQSEHICRTDSDTFRPVSPQLEPSQAVGRIRISDEVIAAVPLLGEPTAFAGLYFLVNALHHLGMAAAVKACPALEEADFACHILRCLARDAQIPEGDAVLQCLSPLGQEFTLPRDALSAIHRTPACRPHIFTRIFTEGADGGFLLRLWAVGVRFWCWRVARLTVREIADRPGRVWLTRADLDVTLPLERADIRIRRVGLDIDPGYVSWFGPWGRVVRFHYRDREGEV